MPLPAMCCAHGSWLQTEEAQSIAIAKEEIT